MAPANANSESKASELKSTLWDAANTLRGSAVDRIDWKGYILPLLFFKQISDVWDQETAEAQKTYGDADPSMFPEVHRFVVPAGCHWNDVHECSSNVGAMLSRAMQEIERANPDTLYRVFGAADWGNKEKFAPGLICQRSTPFAPSAPTVEIPAFPNYRIDSIRRIRISSHKPQNTTYPNCRKT